MFVIVTYDVGRKRAVKTLKVCKRYLKHAQKSVFEGMITEGTLKQLKQELASIIDVTEDQVCIYRVDNLKYTCSERIGLKSSLECNIL